MKPEILMIVAKTNPRQLQPALEAAFTVHGLAQADMADFAPHIAGLADRVRALVTQTAPGADAPLIDALPGLEVIACCGGHVDRIDLDAARARGIPVTNTPGLSAADVGDFVISQLLAVSRRIAEADRFVRAGRWPLEAMSHGYRINRRKLGIVGLGPIGRVVARRAAAFELDVAYHGPRRKDDVPYRYYGDLVEMARDADFLVVTCRSAPETRHLIGWPVFEALGPTGVFVNVSRGVVDDRALVRALGAGAIRGAGIDVFETSPHVPAELLEMENVVLTPHIGGNTRETTQDQTDLVLANLHAHFAGKPLLTPVEAGGH